MRSYLRCYRETEVNTSKIDQFAGIFLSWLGFMMGGFGAYWRIGQMAGFAHTEDSANIYSKDMLKAYDAASATSPLVSIAIARRDPTKLDI